VRQWRRATVATPGECNVAARSGEWAQHFSNASCLCNHYCKCPFWRRWYNRAIVEQETETEG